MKIYKFHQFTFLFFLFCFPAWIGAQSTPNSQAGKAGPENRGMGYLFAAPGAYMGYSDSVMTLHLGGGGEILLYKGLGVGAEVGGLVALQGSGGGLGLFSANGSYHFIGQRKAAPFLTGRYSCVWAHGQRNLANFGVGMNYWIRKSLGIRFEFRDHIYTDNSNRQLLGFRIGIVFR